MTCDYCEKDFEPRRSGRKQGFCPGGVCRKAFYKEARLVGSKALKRRAHSSRLTAHASERDRVNRAKDRAADKLEEYILERARRMAQRAKRKAA